MEEGREGRPELEALRARVAELEQELERERSRGELHRDQVEQLFSVSAAILATADLEEQLRLVAGGIVSACNYRRCVITLFDEEWRVRLRAHAGLSDEEVRSLEETPSVSPEMRRRVLEEKYRIGNSYFVPQESSLGSELSSIGVRTSRTEEEFVDWHPEDLLFVPLRGKDEVILGTISVDDPRDGLRPTEASLRILELFAREAAFAIEQSLLLRELQTAEGYLENVVENSWDAIITTDTEGMIVVWNTGAERMLGWASEDVLGKSVLLAYASKDAAREIMRSLMTGDDAGHLESRETRLVSKTGEEIPVALTASALYAEDGTFLGTAGISRDLRPWKRLEQEIAASEKAATLREVAATLCHEINNSLEEILTAGHVSRLTLDNSDVKEMYEGGGMNKELAREVERLQVISKQALRIGDLTNRLQAHARGGTYEKTEYVDDIEMAKLSPDAPKRAARILVADDREFIREFLREYLTLHGFQVDVAFDGQDAIEHAQAEHYDLVLSDIKMPRKNGYEVFRGVTEADPETKVVLMTAYGYDPSHSIVQASQFGLTDVLFKPFQMAKVRSVIEKALGEAANGNGNGAETPEGDVE